jgi:hypothetical protein
VTVDPEGPAHCPTCHNRLKRIIRCSICGVDTAGDYLRSKWREGNVLSALYFCRGCVDGARQEIGLELSQDDSAAIVRHFQRKEFDRLMEIADQSVSDIAN